MPKNPKEQTTHSPRANLLASLANMQSQLPADYGLVELRKRIGQTLRDVFDGYPVPPRVASGLFLEDEERRSVVFFAFGSSPEREDELSLQLLPFIGRKHAVPEGDIVTKAVAEGTPLLARSIGPPVADNENSEFIVRSLKYRRAEDLLRFEDPIEHLDDASEQGILLEPVLPFPNNRSDREADSFFDSLLVSAVEIPWPYSGERVIGLTLFGCDRLQTLREDLPRLIVDSALGFVLGQLFSLLALRKTHLEHLDPLVDNLLIGSWSEFLSSKKGKNDLVDLLPKLLDMLKAIPTAYALIAAFRRLIELVGVRTFLAMGFAKTLPDLLAQSDTAPLGRVLAKDIPHGELFLAAIDAFSSALTEDERFSSGQLRIRAYQNLSCLLARWRSHTRSTLEKFRGEAETNPRIRLELIALLVSRLTKQKRHRQNDRVHWDMLTDLICLERDPRSRDKLASFAATIIAGQHNLLSLRTVSAELPAWKPRKETTNLLNSQLASTANRLKRKPRRGGPTVIGVLSQKGGVGKSTVALLSAAILSRKRRVCIVELDYGGPTLAAFSPNQPQVFINEILDSYYTRDQLLSKYNNKVKGRLADLTSSKRGRCTIWPADTSFEAQALATASESGGIERRLVEEYMLEDILHCLRDDFDVIIFDAPAEIKDISQSLSGLLSVAGGIALLVGSLSPSSLMPLVEIYWRRMRGPGLAAALVVNRIRSLDLRAAGSTVEFIDFLASHPSIHLNAFGNQVNSPLILETLISDAGLDLVAIPESEEVERAFRHSDFNTLARLAHGQVFHALQAYLEGGA